MFKKTIKFDDLDGNPVEQTFYFNYRKKEVAELMEFGFLVDFQPSAEDMKWRAPLEEMLEKLTTPVDKSGLSQQENTLQAYKIFQALILDAYGVKGADNVTFEKTDETRAYFKSHVAFDNLIFEFIGNEKLAAEFFEECLPPRAREEARRELESRGATPGGSLKDMVEEAERRQKDPVTRIAPGLDSAIDSGVATPEMASVAQKVAASGDQAPEPVKKKPSELTAEDINAMSDEEFSKLDVRQLQGREEMLAAFQRKNKQ